MLLYIAGEGGVGKTQVIKAIGLGHELLQWKNQVLLAATGPVAYKIGGRTMTLVIRKSRDTTRFKKYSIGRDLFILD